jgi:cellulose synthase/poly-beta-1,6-N-acetylglucosamine synthase-like glycosyltransferase
VVTSIVMPWRDSGDIYRRHSYEYVSKKMSEFFVVPCDSGHDPFSRSASKNLGASLVADDILVFLDADTMIPPQQIHDAVDLAREGHMVHPYTEYHGMAQRQSHYIVHGQANPTADTSDWNISWATGGSIVMYREMFFDLGGYDEAYTDWGFEDISLIILGKNRGIELKRIEGNAYHLWHPRAPESEAILAGAERYRREYLKEE